MKATKASGLVPKKSVSPKKSAKSKSKSNKTTRTAEGKFVPGKSGNPSGKPKGSKHLVTKFREEIALALEECEKSGYPLHKMIVETMLATKGNGREFGAMMKALASFLPKEVDIDLNAKFSDLTNDALDKLIQSMEKKLKSAGGGDD